MKKTDFQPGFEAAIPFTCTRLRRRYPESRISWFVPEHCTSESSCGLILFLHGGDQDTPVDQPWTRYLGPRGVIRKWAEQSPYIIAAPSAPPAPDGKRWNHPGTKEYVLDVLEEACRRFPVDRNRVILAGYSMGGFGTYHLSQLLVDRFAGVLWGAGGWWEADFKNLSGLPVFILHGRRDSAPEFKGALPEARHHDWCGFSFAEAAAELLKRDRQNFQFYMHDQGHDPAAEGPQEGLRQFTRWMLPLRRDPNPAEVYLSTPAGSCDPLQEDHHRCFWLEIGQAFSGDISYDRIRLHGPNVAETEEDFQQQTWSLEQLSRSGCSAHALRLVSGAYRVDTQNVAVFRIWLQQKELPATLHAVWNNVPCEAAVIPCRRKLDPSVIYRGYAEFRCC